MASLFRELNIKVGFGHIACKLWGESVASSQKFLAIHGWLDNAGSFDPMMKSFATKDRCIACLDAPGHGLSSHLPKGVPYSPATEIQAMRTVVKHLGWTRFNVIGHSMGGMRAQMYAMCWPDEVESIVLIDGTVIPLGVENKPDCDNPYIQFGKELDKYIRFDTEYHGNHREHTWQELADRWMTASPGLTEDDFTVLMKRGSTRLDNGKYIYTRDAALHNRTNTLLKHTVDTLRTCLNKIQHIPQIMLWMVNKDGEALIKEEYAENVLKLDPRYPEKFELVTVCGTHHHHMQKPEEVNQIIDHFLMKHQITTPKL